MTHRDSYHLSLLIPVIKQRRRIKIKRSTHTERFETVEEVIINLSISYRAQPTIYNSDLSVVDRYYKRVVEGVQSKRSSAGNRSNKLRSRCIILANLVSVLFE